MKCFKRIIACLLIVSVMMLSGCQQSSEADQVEQLSAEEEYTAQPPAESVNAATFGS